MHIFDTPIGTELDSKSQRDVGRVADRLEAYGVHAAVIQGLGDQMPVASNDTPAGRDRNRRVEVWVRQGTE
jgi:phosphate transport system substrate-binding protein